MASDGQKKPACLGPCDYFWFVGILRACLHPEDPRLLTAAPAKCSRFVPHDAKGGTSPQRLSVEEAAERIGKDDGTENR